MNRVVLGKCPYCRQGVSAKEGAIRRKSQFTCLFCGEKPRIEELIDPIDAVKALRSQGDQETASSRRTEKKAFYSVKPHSAESVRFPQLCCCCLKPTESSIVLESTSSIEAKDKITEIVTVKKLKVPKCAKCIRHTRQSEWFPANSIAKAFLVSLIFLLALSAGGFIAEFGAWFLWVLFGIPLIVFLSLTSIFVKRYRMTCDGLLQAGHASVYESAWMSSWDRNIELRFCSRSFTELFCKLNNIHELNIKVNTEEWPWLERRQT